jgi:dipeptidyl aminopeptidase/acylaminoacyl peptidase
MIRAENDTHVLPRNTARWVDFLREHQVNVRVEVLADSNHLFTPPKWFEIHQKAAEFYAGNIGRPEGGAS